MKLRRIASRHSEGVREQVAVQGASAIRPYQSLDKDQKLAIRNQSSIVFIRVHSWLKSANAKTNVADGFAAKALLQFSQDVDLGDLFELVVQCRLEDAHIQNPFAQCHRR